MEPPRAPGAAAAAGVMPTCTPSSLVGEPRALDWGERVSRGERSQPQPVYTALPQPEPARSVGDAQMPSQQPPPSPPSGGPPPPAPGVAMASSGPDPHRPAPGSHHELANGWLLGACG